MERSPAVIRERHPAGDKEDEGGHGVKMGD